MNSALVQFKENLERARDLANLATVIQALMNSFIDVSDIYRSQIVLAVSAMDHLVHELVRLDMIEMAKGARPTTDAYSRFTVPLDQVLSGLPHENWLGDLVREKHSWQSFQDPDKLADAIKLISHVPLWDSVGKALGISAKEVKTQLRVIVDRRNKIAHEADMDPTSPGFRWPITPELAKSATDFIEQVSLAIYKVTRVC